MIYISINGSTIRKNAVNGSSDPPIRIARRKNDKKPIYGHDVWINGPIRLRYSPKNKILVCGARLVLEADADVMVREKSGGRWTLIKNK